MAKFNDEYKEIYTPDDEDSRSYEEVNENEEPEDIIKRLKGTIKSGDCLYCGGKNTMTYEGNICFVCSKCKKSTHENIYYLWAAGHPVEIDDEW